MLTVSELDVSIGTVDILRRVSLELPGGAMAGLIGRNGAGKTTLMRSIMGLLPARHGRIRFHDHELTRTPAHLRAPLGIGYMPEDRRLVPELSVQENILVPAWATQLPASTERWQRVCAMIPEIQPLAERKALQLSGGQQKLVAIGRALMCGSRLLLLDEPFEGVAPALSRRIAEVIAGLKREGLSIIVSESDLQHSAEMLDCVFRIERGEVRRE
ncbi:MAG TPA: ATP-binding cassette domain-containing protein [Ottowia sp.]|uniref:ATP-binding cassette domain-containing protein n=1 Tax=Ottowia sp. TaxID=1898956 RepID=UPI002CC497B0|nr:ATP-binding cassette domain-containing protein [Ottowia sp.]HMN20766.1 ATP-binding cassette domain-containing protein [Ottowia sp.]